MIDPDDPTSFIDDLAWTEPELIEFLRSAVQPFTKAMTFEPCEIIRTRHGIFKAVNVQHADLRTITLVATVACEREKQSETFAAIRASLKGQLISCQYSRATSTQAVMVIAFTAPRFKPLAA